MKNLLTLFILYVFVFNTNAQNPPPLIEIISYPDTIKTTDTISFLTSSYVYENGIDSNGIHCSPLYHLADSLKNNQLLFDLTFDITGNGMTPCYRHDSLMFINPPKGNLTLISFYSSIAFPGTSSEYRFNRTGSDTVTIFVEDPTGITENKTSKFSISPNPVRDFLKIEQLQNSSLEQIEVWDMNGRKVKKVNQNFKSIDLSELDSGIYLLRLFSEGANENIKIVKQ